MVVTQFEYYLPRRHGIHGDVMQEFRASVANKKNWVTHYIRIRLIRISIGKFIPDISPVRNSIKINFMQNIQ